MELSGIKTKCYKISNSVIKQIFIQFYEKVHKIEIDTLFYILIKLI